MEIYKMHELMFLVVLFAMAITFANGLPMLGLRILVPYDKSSYTVGANGNHGDVVIRTGTAQAFRMVRGLDGHFDTVSFQSLVNNNQYIRCNNNTVYLENADNSIQFKRDASFFVRQNKYFVWYSAIESAKQPGHFLRHSNEKLVLHADDGTDKFKKEASYLLAPYEPRTGKNWKRIQGEVDVITTGQSGVWAISQNGQVIVREGTYNYGIISPKPSPGFSWSSVPGVKLRDISSGFNIVWGTDYSNKVYVRRGINGSNPSGTHWQQVMGIMKRISVNPRTNEVWSLTSFGYIFRREGVPRIEMEGDAAGKRWRWIPGRLKFISCGDVGVWGLDFAGRVMYRTGTRIGYGPGRTWQLVEGKILKQLHTGDDIVWGVDNNNKIHVRLGISDSSPTGTHWLRIGGNLKYVAVNNIDNSVWGIGPFNHHNLIFFRKDARLVNTGFSPWTNFGQCDNKFGYRTRLRYCIEEAPGYPKVNCIGPTTDFLECNLYACAKA